MSNTHVKRGFVFQNAEAQTAKSSTLALFHNSFYLGYSITHSDKIIDLSSDERSHDSQVLLKLSSANGTEEVFSLVSPKHHLLILGQELPHPSTHLPKGRVKTDALTPIYYL